jgi:hypothetical protein
VVVEALRIQRERWQDVLMKKLANDPSVSAVPFDQIQQGIERHEKLLKRLRTMGRTPKSVVGTWRTR